MKIIYNLLFTTFSILYILSFSFDPLTVSWLIKILPILVLVIALGNAPAFEGKTLLLIALTFSAGGDVLLEQGLFIYGIGAFLIAQFHYGVFFFSKWTSVKTRWPISACIVTYMLVMALLLAPHVGDLTLPVYAYLVVIGLMGILAVQSSMTLRWSVLGALVFILSDSFIAIDRFLHPLPLSGYLIMTSYYLAQWMLIQGAIANIKNRALGFN